MYLHKQFSEKQIRTMLVYVTRMLDFNNKTGIDIFWSREDKQVLVNMLEC